MKSLLKTSVGAVALLAGASLAMAQDTATTGTASAQAGADITCSQITGLDSDEAERALYFLAGRQMAQGSAGSGMDTGASTGMETDTTASAPDTGADVGTGTDTTASTSDSSASTELGSDTSAGATSGTGSDTMAADDTGADMGADMGTDTTTTAATGGASSALSGTGYFDIQVESVMSACEDNPESQVSQILRQESGGSMQ